MKVFYLYSKVSLSSVLSTEVFRVTVTLNKVQPEQGSSLISKLGKQSGTVRNSRSQAEPDVYYRYGHPLQHSLRIPLLQLVFRVRTGLPKFLLNVCQTLGMRSSLCAAPQTGSVCTVWPLSQTYSTVTCCLVLTTKGIGDNWDLLTL